MAETALSQAPRRRTLVVGASRGVGLAIAEALLARDDTAAVFATARAPERAGGLRRLADAHPGRVVPLALDVTDDASLEALPGRLRELVEGLDLVVHCAGVLHAGELQPEKALAQCRRENLLRSFEVNSLGPLLTARAVLPLLPKDRPAAFAALSAMVGSIGDNRLGGWYGYRASKAALNQFLRTLAIEAKRRHRQLRVLAIHPGTTDTGLSRPFQGNVPDDRLYTPAQSAERILAVIDGTTSEDSGGFFNWNGERIPW